MTNHARRRPTGHAPGMPAVTRAWLVAGLLAAAAILAGAGAAAWQWTRPHPPAGGPAHHPVAAGPAHHPPAGRLAYPPEPAHRIMLGAYTALSGQADTERAIEGREAAMGHRYALQLTFYDWNDPFPDFGEATIAAHGRIPVMAWYGPGKNRSDHRTLAEINDGRDDAWILRQAVAIRDFRRPIFLRLMIEMNGNWYRGYSGSPAAYIAAWRRIHALFTRARARNVVWVWCPNVTPDDWDAYYPGNAYVDVIGVDGYNNTVTDPSRSFEQIFGSFLAHYAHRKPLMIGETATSASEPSTAAAFIAAMHSYLKDVAGPRYGVIAVCWFDTDTSDSDNWRVDQTPAAWRAWLALARDPYFGGHYGNVNGRQFSRAQH